MHTTSVLGIAKVFTTALLSLQAKSVLTPGQPVAAKRFSRDVRIRQVGLVEAPLERVLIVVRRRDKFRSFGWPRPAAQGPEFIDCLAEALLRSSRGFPRSGLCACVVVD